MSTANGSYLKHLLMDIDPGHVRLRISLKTTFMCAVTLGIGLLFLDKISSVIATLSVFFVFLSTQGKTRPQQQITQLLAICTLIIILALGMFIQGHTWIFNTLLVISCFLAFYLRRFGDRYLVFPSVSTSLFLLTSAFQLIHPWLLLMYMLIILPCSTLVCFYCFPPKITLQTQHHFFNILYLLWRMSQRLNQYFIKAGNSSALNKEFHRMRHIEHVLKNQAILVMNDTSATKIKDQQTLITLYAFYRVLELIADNIKPITHVNPEIFAQLKPSMASVFQGVEAVLFEIQNHYHQAQYSHHPATSLYHHYEVAAAGLYNPQQPVGHSLVHYSNILFAARRIAELAQTWEPA